MADIEIKGRRLHVTDTGGDLPPVVFLHGFLFDGRQFDAQVQFLSDRYRCVTIEFPGQGRSGRSAVGYSTESLSAVMALALQHLDLGPAHLVGLSMGGFAGMRIAVRRPDLLASLVLVNTSAAPTSPCRRTRPARCTRRSPARSTWSCQVSATAAPRRIPRP